MQKFDIYSYMKKFLLSLFIGAAAICGVNAQTTVVERVVYVTNTVVVQQPVVIQQPVAPPPPTVVYEPAPVVVYTHPYYYHPPYHYYPRPVIGIGIGLRFGGGYHHR